MSNIRTVNKRHKRAVAATIARSRTAQTPTPAIPAQHADKPVQAAG